MFRSLKRIVYQVADLEKAKEWYSGLLDQVPLFDTPFAVIFKVGECTLSLSRGHPPLPEPSERVETYWDVEDIDEAYERLIALGATGHTPPKQVLSIRIARVIDPFGNLLCLTGALPEKKLASVEEQPSETALVVAFCRALAAREEREEIRGPDILAELFLTEEGKKPLQDAASRRWAIEHLVTSPLYGYFIARTAYIDQIFTLSLAESIPQIVILGAGYDTRAYRYRDFLEETRIFEVDISPTQKRKVAVLSEAKIDIPAQVSFVNANFRVDDLAEVLKRSGFDRTARTLFLWEGVTYYLTEGAVRKTLDHIADHAAGGSTICLDYLTEKLESVNPGEPFRFWIPRAEFGTFFARSGFDIVEQLDGREMERRYLTQRDGSLAEKSLPQFSLVYGRVRNR